MMPYSIYPNIPRWLVPLSWSEVFPNVEDFVAKMVEVGGYSDNLEELYIILANKYAVATTRYVIEEPFILALRRELMTAWPTYVAQKKIQDAIREMTIEDITLQMQSIRDNQFTGENSNTNTSEDESVTSGTSNSSGTDENLQNVVNSNNSPIANADSIAITNKSNSQTSNKGSNENEVIDTGSSESSSTSSGTANSESESIENYKQLGNKLEAYMKQYEAANRDYLTGLYRKVDGLFKVLL